MFGRSAVCGYFGAGCGRVSLMLVSLIVIGNALSYLLTTFEIFF